MGSICEYIAFSTPIKYIIHVHISCNHHIIVVGDIFIGYEKKTPKYSINLQDFCVYLVSTPQGQLDCVLSLEQRKQVDFIPRQFISSFINIILCLTCVFFIILNRATLPRS